MEELTWVVGVGLLGCGEVGAAVVRGLARLPAAMRPEVRAVAVRDLGARRDCTLPPRVLTTDPRAVVDDASVHVVIESLGGIDPVGALIGRALALGKPVVTSNHCRARRDGSRAAPASGESRCAAAVRGRRRRRRADADPMVRALSGLMRADEIIKIEGVLNGTTTYALSHAFAEARRYGFAEADWSRDVDGDDAADKLAVLAQYVSGEAVYSRDVHRVGIDRLDHDRSVGSPDRSWRLVAAAVRGGDARLEPVALPPAHPFAQLSGPQNTITVTATWSGAVTLIGTGAGGEAAACSIVADVLAARDWLATVAGAG